MEHKTRPLHESRLVFQTAFLLFNLYLLSKIASSSTTDEVRDRVRERAGGKCEGCKKENTKLLVAHMYHGHNQNYDNAHYLKAYCVVCEFKHHASHVGRESEIGLNETDNNTTTNSLWQTILRECSKEEIAELFEQYNAPIRTIYKKFGYRISRLRNMLKSKR